MAEGKPLHRWFYPLVVSQVVGATALFAAGADDLISESAFLAELPVVLTASRLGQPASDAPNAITVIDRELIRASGAREIVDLFRLVPGMHVTYAAYAKGLQGIATYHGLGSEFANRMQVLVDGRAVYNPTVAEVSWTNLPLALEDIERIEVVRGPSAASHGANAFVGAINIVTRHPAQDRGFYGGLTLGTRSVDERVLRYGGSAGDLDYRFTAAYRKDDPYEAIADSRRIRLFTFRGDQRLGNRDTLTFQAGYNGGARETQGPTSTQPDPIDYPREIRVRNYFQQVQWVRALEGGDELSVQFYHNYLETHDEVLTQPIALLGNQRFLIDDSWRAHRYDLELQHTVRLRPALRTVWGGSFRYDSAIAPSTLASKVGNHSRRLFGHAEWRAAPRWLLNAGAMLEHTDFTGTDLSPRLSLNYQLAPRHTLRASLSKAYRNPSLFEESADRKFILGNILVQRFLGSGNLAPERIVSRELGYVGEFPKSGISVDARVFFDRMSGLIREVGNVPFVPPPGLVAFPNAITRDFRNTTNAEQTGFETQLRWRLKRSTRLGFAQSYIHTRSDDPRIVASVPRATYSAFVVHDFGGGFSGSLLAFHSDAVRLLGFAEPQSAVTRVDLRLAHQFRVGASRVEAALVVQDLLNEGYTDFRHDNVFDRRAYVTLRLEL